ncbi:MAG: Smr/MutS family protein, partial [Pseudomonadota bacterium]
IDLHGMTQNEAFDRLSRFLQHAYDSGRRTVLVITGKGSRGEGVLKSAVPIWLEEPHFRKITTGYHEASISHGGSGALYIRLRRKRAI